MMDEMMQENFRDNKYKIKFHKDDEISIRLPVDFTRAGLLEAVTDSFSLLYSKGRSKTKYIVDSIKWKEEHRELKVYDELYYFARRFYYYKMNYGLENLKDFQYFFEDDKNFELLEDRLEPFRHKPAKMTLGFDRFSYRAKEVFEKLGNVAPKVRVTTIAEATLDYVKSGNDINGEILFADKFLYKLMKEYKGFNENIDGIENFFDALNLMIEQSEKILENRFKY